MVLSTRIACEALAFYIYNFIFVCDLILIDLQQPNMQPLNYIEKNLVYSGSKQNVLLTMVDGKILYEKGRFYIGEAPETIYAYANDVIKRMKA